MGFLVCNKCEGYYELKPGESPNDFDKNCECGGRLISTSSLPPNFIKDEKREVISHGHSYTDQKSFNFKLVIAFGVVLIIAGLLGMIMVNFLGLLLIMIGVFVLFEGYQKGSSWIKGEKGEKIVSRHIKGLPNGYHIFEDVTIPNGKGNIDHLVIGPTGIFVIETKNYSGSFQIYGDKWKRKNRFSYSNIKSSPGKQAKRNSFDLSKLLNSKKVVKRKIWVNAVVSLLCEDFKVMKKPKYYSIVRPEDVPKFILNYKDKIDKETVVSVFNFIQDYSTHILYREGDVYIEQDWIPHLYFN